ncbi:SacI homology domain-containing protein [Mucor mucedo]|uniref:SacI homology domain-containing protein n=1 Tax=Mucor mucedo TaxID=29922 RepID=UPI00221E8630|nr:SacI homology domain-containing protein [Mucor mucedo]KAI7879226.1 SacI homology domain-containing protein [Mucor mucedo]
MYKDFKLYITKKAYVLAPTTGPNLTVHRDSGLIELSETVPPTSEQESTLNVYGLLGFIKLWAGDYMLTITKREQIGTIYGKAIYRVGAFQILPLAENLSSLNENQRVQEQEFVDLLESHLKNNTFYYSYDYDLTQSIQRQNQFSSEKLAEPLYKKADERFFWNRFVSSKLIDASIDVSNFILPVMQGFVEFNTCKINNKNFVWGLITRRSRHRPGTRFFSRGIDAEGHVSNFVETEQLVLYDGPSASQSVEGKIELSYVQTRGSIPVYWAQVINLKYTPRLWIGESRKSLAAARAHFDEQIRIYGPQILVNLINKKGYELPMGQAFARTVEQLNDPRIYYTHFDFHSECSKMRWHRIQLLVDQLKEKLIEQGYTYVKTTENGPVVVKTQTSVVRTNCMDCLDRTNVVQSTLARWVLTEQLREVGILEQNQKVEDQEDFMISYRNTWADNADGVSCVYSGTGALKTDFTRTGQRTKAGALNDLSNSITRYVKNNFLDGNRQDSFDLFLGRYRLENDTSAKTHNPFDESKALRVRVVPYILLFALFMLILNIVRPGYSGFQSVSSYLLLLLFWVSVLISGVRFALQHGSEFVQWPHLVKLPPTDDVCEAGGFTEKGNMSPPEFAEKRPL